jgi:phage protein D
MIFKSQSRISPSIDFTINNTPTKNASIVKMELGMGENNHDILRVSLAGVPPRLITEYLSKPVYCYWGFGIDHHEFCGYIASVEPSYTGTDGTIPGSTFQLVELICIGASYKMRAKKTRLWENASIQSVAVELADLYKFSVSTFSEPFAYPRIIQTEESDWAFLNKVAKMYGLSVSVHGTHIHVWNPQNSLGRQISYHELKNIKARNGDTSTYPATILSMRGVFGDSISATNTHVHLATVLDNQGNIYTSDRFDETSGFGQKIDLGITDNISVNATSTIMADALVAARTRGISTLTANLSLTGTAGALPGGIVNISNFESNFEGFWYVKEVTHTITRDEFFTEMTVSREDTNDIASYMTMSSRIPEIPSPAFINNLWQASTQLEDIYV